MEAVREKGHEIRRRGARGVARRLPREAAESPRAVPRCETNKSLSGHLRRPPTEASLIFPGFCGPFTRPSPLSFGRTPAIIMARVLHPSFFVSLSLRHRLIRRSPRNVYGDTRFPDRPIRRAASLESARVNNQIRVQPDFWNSDFLR